MIVPTEPVSLTPEKVAIPPDAAWVVPPEIVPELAVTTTFWLDCEPVDTRLLSWSRISTTAWVVKFEPLDAPAASVVTANWWAGP